jgi:hypothetical protein
MLYAVHLCTVTPTRQDGVKAWCFEHKTTTIRQGVVRQHKRHVEYAALRNQALLVNKYAKLSTLAEE